MVFRLQHQVYKCPFVVCDKDLENNTWSLHKFISDEHNNVPYMVNFTFCVKALWSQLKLLCRTMIMCEVFTCLYLQSLSPFPLSCAEAEYNKAVVVWACSPECPLSLTSASFPFISFPSCSFEQPPPEWLVSAQWEVFSSPLLQGMTYHLKVLCVHVPTFKGEEAGPVNTHLTGDLCFLRGF